MKSRADNLKTRLLLIVTAFLCIQFSGLCQVVDIPDPALREAIRRELSKPSGDITVGDMESITKLILNYCPESLEGMQSAKNLKNMYFGHPYHDGFGVGPTISFADSIPGYVLDAAWFEPLINLTELREITMDAMGYPNNAVDSIGIVLHEGLTALNELSIRHLKVSYLTFPNKFSNLKKLEISNLGLTDFNFLENIPSLTSLIIFENELTHIDLPEEMKGLTHLNLSGSQINDFSFLEGLGNLTELNLAGNGLTNLAFPQNLQNLTSLVLTENPLIDFSFLNQLPNLTNLSLRFCELQHLELSQNYASITHLDLMSNRLRGFEFLKNFPNLIDLNIQANELTHIILPDDLSNLEILKLNYNHLTYLVIPPGYSKLSRVELRENDNTTVYLPASKDRTELRIGGWRNRIEIEIYNSLVIPDPELKSAIRVALDKPTGDITVEDMESLTELDASLGERGFDAPLIHNLKGIEAAVNLTSLNLTGFSLGGRGITSPNLGKVDFSVLHRLQRLTTLSLNANLLTDSSFLEGLTSLTELNLWHNNLTNLTLPGGLTELTRLDISGNDMASLTLSEDLTNLTTLDLSGNQLTDFSFMEGMTSLTTLNLNQNNLTNVKLPEGLDSLTTLNLQQNGLRSLTLPEGMTKLATLDLSSNFGHLTTLNVPVGFNIDALDLGGFGKSKVTFYIPLSVELASDNVEVNWTQGVLQSRDKITGAWTDIPTATSPYQIEPTEPQRFFRVRSE